MPIPDERRDVYQRWLCEITRLPTAAGHEHHVIRWIEHWVEQRPDLLLERDVHGNLVVRAQAPWGGGQAPVFITAHLDHPAFVVERLIDSTHVELSFRGGVMEDYFPNARINLYHGRQHVIGAAISSKAERPHEPFKLWIAELDESVDWVRPGDIATWHFPEQEITEGVLHTNACDDLAAVAAALATLEELRLTQNAGQDLLDVRLLFTRAEEIGFIGAIGACIERTMPLDSRVIALENSRSFTDSPIGGGPIVRVGDRVSVFTPELTGAVAKVAEDIAGGPAIPLASQKNADGPHWRWQRKLMAGGACEASVFCSYGYQSTCICLPLGNYHNMADLDAVQAGTNTSQPRVGREYIALSDYFGMVELLVSCGQSLPDRPPFKQRVEKLWTDLAFVLGS